jgi:hypothetical protein
MQESHENRGIPVWMGAVGFEANPLSQLARNQSGFSDDFVSDTSKEMFLRPAETD